MNKKYFRSMYNFDKTVQFGVSKTNPSLFSLPILTFPERKKKSNKYLVTFYDTKSVVTMFNPERVDRQLILIHLSPP